MATVQFTKKQRTPKPLADRFWPKVIKGEGCWLWTATKDALGYGMIQGPPRSGGSTVMRAHRVSWVIHFGPIPDGLLICHKCDTPSCVRPSHLFLGTDATNHADMTAKGRRRFDPPRGERNGHARLDRAKVLEIRGASGTHKAIGEKYGVSQPTVSMIKSRARWGHV